MLIIFTDSNFDNDLTEIIGGANRGISTIQEAQEAVITHYETVVKPRYKKEAEETGYPQDLTLYLAYNEHNKLHRNEIARVSGESYGVYILVSDNDIYTVDLKEEGNESGEGTSTEEE